MTNRCTLAVVLGLLIFGGCKEDPSEPPAGNGSVREFTPMSLNWICVESLLGTILGPQDNTRRACDEEAIREGSGPWRHEDPKGNIS
jgi:hypothetical protein